MFPKQAKSWRQSVVRNFVTGIVWGGLVSVAGLGVLSQMVPLHEDKLEAAAPANDAGPVVTEAAQAAAEPAPEVAQAPSAPEAIEAPETAEPLAEVALPAPAAEPAPPETAPLPAALPEPLAEPSAAPDEPLLAPLASADALPPAQVVPEMAEPGQTGTAPAPDSAPQQPLAQEAAADSADKADLAMAAEQEPEGRQSINPAQAAIMAEPALPEAELPEAVVPETELPAAELPEADPAMQSPPAEPALIVPDAALAEKQVEGVRTDRLPVIADAPATEPVEPGPDSLATADLTPLQRFARPFENPTSKPLFAVLLTDPGTPDLNREGLATLPFPITFVVDPMADGAAEAAAIYRAAGQEVVMLASLIPEGATAADLEQSFAGFEATLPEALALVDSAIPVFQDNRGLAAEVVTLLAAQGRGVVTFDRGLNSADQIARREGVPAAKIYRDIDAGGEKAPLIRRYLDRAAFKAAQEGQVTVIGTAQPETITALMEWAVEGRAASVALAPLSAVLARP